MGLMLGVGGGEKHIIIKGRPGVVMPYGPVIG